MKLRPGQASAWRLVHETVRYALASEVDADQHSPGRERRRQRLNDSKNMLATDIVCKTCRNLQMTALRPSHETLGIEVYVAASRRTIVNQPSMRVFSPFLWLAPTASMRMGTSMELRRV